MNSKFSNQVFVAKDVARTGTQINAPLSGGYAALGEVVLVDESGTLVEAAGITSKSQILTVVMRSSDDKIYKSTPINGAYVKSAYVKKYDPPVQQIVKFTVPDEFAAYTNYNFVIRIRDWKPRESYFPRWKTADFAVTTAKTVGEIATGLATSINANFASDRNFPVVAGANVAGEVCILALAPYFEAGKYKYEHFRFIVEPVGSFNFGTSFATNMPAKDGATAITTPNNMTGYYNPYAIPQNTTYNNATIGSGSVEDAKELEWYYINNFYAKNGRRFDVPYEFTPIALNVEAGKCYDKLIINLEYGKENANNAYSTTLPSSITVLIPLGANQGNDFIAGINEYFTLWGIPNVALTTD